jgi:hypothetical protein
VAPLVTPVVGVPVSPLVVPLVAPLVALLVPSLVAPLVPPVPVPLSGESPPEQLAASQRSAAGTMSSLPDRRVGAGMARESMPAAVACHRPVP